MLLLLDSLLQESIMVSLPRVATCCACASLRTGSLIIGAINLAGCILMLLCSLALLAGSASFIQFLDENDPGWRNDLGAADLETGEGRRLVLCKASYSAFSLTFQTILIFLFLLLSTSRNLHHWVGPAHHCGDFLRHLLLPGARRQDGQCLLDEALDHPGRHRPHHGPDQHPEGGGHPGPGGRADQQPLLGALGLLLPGHLVLQGRGGGGHHAGRHQGREGNDESLREEMNRKHVSKLIYV